MFKAKSLLAAVLGMGFSMGVVPDIGGGTTVDPNAAPAAPDVSASGVVGATVAAVVGAVDSAVTAVESFADKASKYFTSKNPVHLSDALVPMGGALDDLTVNAARKSDVNAAVASAVSSTVSAAVAPLQATLATQAQSITDLQTQISTLVQKVAQATS
jgi:hypothetical protein